MLIVKLCGYIVVIGLTVMFVMLSISFTYDEYVDLKETIDKRNKK